MSATAQERMIPTDQRTRLKRLVSRHKMRLVTNKIRRTIKMKKADNEEPLITKSDNNHRVVHIRIAVE